MRHRHQEWLSHFLFVDEELIQEGSERLAGGKRSATTGTRTEHMFYPGGITAVRITVADVAIALSSLRDGLRRDWFSGGGAALTTG